MWFVNGWCTFKKTPAGGEHDVGTRASGRHGVLDEAGVAVEVRVVQVELRARRVEGEAEETLLAARVGEGVDVDERHRVDSHVAAGHVQDPDGAGPLGDEEVVGPSPGGHGDGVGKVGNRLEGKVRDDPALRGRAGPHRVTDG
ncbi:MAG: hypothetical protein ABW279_11035 [Acidimicrobiales bacterium]